MIYIYLLYMCKIEMLLLVRVMICNNVGYEEDRQKILIVPAYLHLTLKHA